MRVSHLRLLGATVLAFMLVNSFGVNLNGARTGQQWLEGDRVVAQSGGRARGGSFDRRPSGGSGGGSGGSFGGGGGGGFQPAPAPYGGSPYGSRPYSRPYNPGPVIIPVPAGGGYGGYGGGGYVSPGGGGSLGGLVFVVLFLIFPIASMYLARSGQRGGSRTSRGGYAPVSELNNDIVTVTRLQVAMLAQARYIQERLTDLSIHADTETPEGLAEMLRETVLALMRTPENWTHVSATSQSVRGRQQAAQLFEQLSIAERSKFTAETLVKVGGKVRRQALERQAQDPSAYIVVTLLLGTEDDRPLFSDKIYSTAELQAAQKRIGAITPAYLLIYELLWSPQDPSDSLTHEELLASYPDLIQL